MSAPQVVTPDGTAYSIKKWYADEESDLAMLQIKANGLKPVTFTKQGPQIGDPVVALGTPVTFTLRNSATGGIISGIDRSVDAGYKLIQTDAAINPGNSGGPLVNMNGEVIGINSMKFMAYGVESMGFAIPADTVEMAIRHFLKYGKIKRPALGIEFKESWGASLGLPSAEPLQVTEVRSASARKAGIREGDVLYAVDGLKVKTMTDVNEALKLRLPGQRVSLTMQSDGDLVERTVRLAEG